MVYRGFYALFWANSKNCCYIRLQSVAEVEKNRFLIYDYDM